MKRLRIRHRRAQPDPERQCDYCMSGNHQECSGEDIYGERCECTKCEADADAAGAGVVRDSADRRPAG
jgi:D-arabinose 1-dehydrogenase-like Zn-dependent alcohol dehydrogenase